MDLLRNIAGFILFVAILLPIIGYFPITFLIALWQVEQAKDWETTTCIATCGSSKTKSTVGYEYKYWINYGFKSRLERPKSPSLSLFPKMEFPKPDPKLPVAEWSRKSKEAMAKWREESEKLRQKEKEEREKYERELEIYEKEEEKLRSGGTQYISIFQLGSWRYWGSYGWSEICSDEFGNRRKPSFETDCYIDPNNREKAVFYRKLGFNWAWTILLTLNFLVMFGFLWLAVYLFRYDMRRAIERKRKTVVPGIFGN